MEYDTYAETQLGNKLLVMFHLADDEAAHWAPVRTMYLVSRLPWLDRDARDRLRDACDGVTLFARMSECWLSHKR